MFAYRKASDLSGGFFFSCRVINSFYVMWNLLLKYLGYCEVECSPLNVGMLFHCKPHSVVVIPFKY